MSIDYNVYPKNWKGMRKRILERAGHCCEFCKVENYQYVFRGMYEGGEVFQTNEGYVYSYPSGELLCIDMNIANCLL